MEGASSELGRAFELFVRPAKECELVNWTGETTGAVESKGRERVALALFGWVVVKDRAGILGRDGGGGADRGFSKTTPEESLRAGLSKSAT